MSGGALPRPNPLLTMRGLLPALNEQEQKVGQYVLDHPYQVIHLAMADLAERCGVGDTTIFRFCRRVRTEGYQDFKIWLAQELAPPDPPIYAALAAGDTLTAAAHQVIAGDVKALEATLRVLDLGALDRATAALLAARRVDIYGSGGSAVTALDLQYKLMRVGVRELPYTDAQLMALSASRLTPADLALGISHSGAAAEVLQAVQSAKKAGAPIVALTNHPASPIARLADISLCTAAPGGTDRCALCLPGTQASGRRPAQPGACRGSARRGERLPGRFPRSARRDEESGMIVLLFGWILSVCIDPDRPVRIGGIGL